MKFCPLCESIMEDVISTVEIYHQCTRCNKRVETDAKDSMRFNQSFDDSSDSIRRELILKNAIFDNINPRIYKKCPSCEKEIVQYVVIGNNMRFIYTCTCGAIFN